MPDPTPTDRERYTALRDDIAAFLDSGPYTLCTFREAGDNGRADRSPPTYESWDEGYVPAYKPVDQLLAEWLEKEEATR